jgi:formylglycine-generating enzyme required for sulfatase activity
MSNNDNDNNNDNSPETLRAKYMKTWDLSQGKPPRDSGTMVLVPGGSMIAGVHRPEGETPTDWEMPPHPIRTDDLYVDTVPVSERLWNEVMGIAEAGSDKPKLHVAWYDAVEFCNRRSKLCGLRPCYIIVKGPNNEKYVYTDDTAPGFRLPFEHEWEYVARSGSSEPLPQEAFGSSEPNDAGVYDMLGHEFEWTSSTWSDPPKVENWPPKGYKPPKTGLKARASRKR